MDVCIIYILQIVVIITVSWNSIFICLWNKILRGIRQILNCTLNVNHKIFKIFLKNLEFQSLSVITSTFRIAAKYQRLKSHPFIINITNILALWDISWSSVRVILPLPGDFPRFVLIAVKFGTCLNVDFSGGNYIFWVVSSNALISPSLSSKCLEKGRKVASRRDVNLRVI